LKPRDGHCQVKLSNSDSLSSLREIFRHSFDERRIAARRIKVANGKSRMTSAASCGGALFATAKNKNNPKISVGRFQAHKV
jgi:hypothetical protein